jgi:hypothetical protein
MLFVHVFVAQNLADSDRKAAQQDLQKAFADTFRSVPAKLRTGLTSNPADLKKFISQKNNELDQKLKMVSKTRVPMLTLILGISNAFPPEVKVDVNTLQLDDRTFNLDGVLYKGSIEAVTERLKSNKALGNVTLQQNGQRFSYRGDVVGR